MTSSPWRALPLILAGVLPACSSETPASLPPSCAALPSSATIHQLAFSSDGRWLAAAHADDNVTMLELGGPGSRRLAAVSQGGSPARIALTEDGGLLLAGARDGVKVWRAAEGSLVRQLAVGAGPIVTLKLSDAPEPFVLVSIARPADGSDNIKIWRLADGALVGQLAGSALATFTHADTAVLLLDEGRQRFDVVSFLGRPIRGAALPEPLSHPAFANDGAFLAGVVSTGGDERLATMSVGDDAFVWRSTEPARGTRALVFLENPSRILQLADRARLYDHQDGRVLAELPALAAATVAAAAPDGSAVAATAPDGGILLVSTADGSSRVLACPGPAR